MRNLPSNLLKVALLGVVGTVGASNRPAQAAQPTWSQQCVAALQSRALLARSGALLALRDRTLQHPAEVLEVYRREPNPMLRRRMALVLGEASMRGFLLNRAVQRRPELASAALAFEAELEMARTPLLYETTKEGYVAPEGGFELARIRDEAKSQILSKKAQTLLGLLATAIPRHEDERERQLLRWDIGVAVLDAMPPQTKLPLWTQLSPTDQVQVMQMFSAVDARESLPLALPQGYEKDPGTPYIYGLRLMATGRFRFWQGYGANWPNLRALELRPLAPLLRVGLSPGLGGLYYRSTLAKWGDKAALQGLSLEGISDSDGRYALDYSTIKARLGVLEGVDELWQLKGKTPHDWLGALGKVLDVGVGAFPEYGSNLEPWLSAEDKLAFRENEKKRNSRFLRRISLESTPEMEAYGSFYVKARSAYAAALRTAYERERATLRYSPATQRFYSPGRARGNEGVALPPVQPGLVGVGDEDAAAYDWYRTCARHAFDADLDVAVGATRGLLWGEKASAQALEQETRHLERRNPDQAAVLASLRRFVPGARSSSTSSKVVASYEPVMRYISTNYSASTYEIEPPLRAQLQPSLIPFLVVYAEQKPRLWDFLVELKAHKARPFLVREVAREKTGNNTFWPSPKRDEYISGYFAYLCRAVEFYHASEATEALKRQVQTGWANPALAALGSLGGPETVAYLHKRLEAWQPRTGDRDRDAEKGILLAQLARNGEAKYLKESVEVLRTDWMAAPREAARALRASLPFDGPDFSDDLYDPPSDETRERVYAAWSRWLQEHQNQLKWNPATRRYDLQPFVKNPVSANAGAQ